MLIGCAALLLSCVAAEYPITEHAVTYWDGPYSLTGWLIYQEIPGSPKRPG